MSFCIPTNSLARMPTLSYFEVLRKSRIFWLCILSNFLEKYLLTWLPSWAIPLFVKIVVLYVTLEAAFLWNSDFSWYFNPFSLMIIDQLALMKKKTVNHREDLKSEVISRNETIPACLPSSFSSPRFGVPPGPGGTPIWGWSVLLV